MELFKELWTASTPEAKQFMALYGEGNLIISNSDIVIMSENDLVKYDYLSKYYTDACYTYTTQQGTDITLKDRE